MVNIWDTIQIPIMKIKTAAILRKLAKTNGGLLTPEAVVEFARPKTSPLHKRFLWDDTEAAHQYRLWQARQMISVTVRYVDMDGKRTPTRVFVSLSPDRDRRHGGYREMVDVLSDSSLRKQMLNDAVNEMELFEMKYQTLNELSKLFKVSKQLREEFTQ